jgi:hypothetical protein
VTYDRAELSVWSMWGITERIRVCAYVGHDRAEYMEYIRYYMAEWSTYVDSM